MNRRRRSSLFVGLFVAGVLTVFMNTPSLSTLLTVPGSSTLHMDTADQDRAYYLSRIKQASEGHWLIGNSALYEHRLAVSPNGFVETATAALMRITNLSLASAVLVTNLLLPFLILALTYFWMERILRSRLLTIASLLTTWFALFGPLGLLRESSPKVTLLFPSLYLTALFCMREGRLQRVVRGSLIGLMMYTYHYHWTLLFVFEGLLILRALFLERRPLLRTIREELWVWVPLILIALPYGFRLFSLQGDPIAADMWRRFGMIETHLPTAPLLQFSTLCWIAALTTLRLTGIKRDRESLLLLLLLIAGLVAVNSNVFSGREAEFEGHYGRIIRFFSWTALFLCIGTLLEKGWIQRLAGITIVVVGLNAVLALPGLIQAAETTEQAWQASGKQEILDWLSANTPQDSVILAPFSLASLVPVFTHDYVFMNYAARSFSVSDQELLDRYIVQIAFFPEDSESIDTGVQSVFGNFPGSTYSKTKRIEQIRTLFRKPFTKTIADFIPDQEKRTLLERVLKNPDPALALQKLQQFRLDYLVSTDPLPRTLSRNFKEMARVGDYTVFQLVR
jgi:hypothetical protein